MTYTLIADGTSDRVLLPILTWSLRAHGVGGITEQWADLTRIPHRYQGEQRLRAVFDLYPCDVLFFHRDAEGQRIERRREEIAAALQWATVPYVPVIPVRMTESWLLTDELAIRSAAANPNGTVALDLPPLRRIEQIPNPKQVLYDALANASGLNARRRPKLRIDQCVHFIPNYIDDYSRLSALSSFRALQNDIRRVLETLAER